MFYWGLVQKRPQYDRIYIICQNNGIINIGGVRLLEPMYYYTNNGGVDGFKVKWHETCTLKQNSC